MTSSLQGGKFGHGFFSAGVTKGAGGAWLPGGDKLSGGQVAYGTVVSAVIGGTASVVAGGKFANGAKTAAFQYLYNQVDESLRAAAIKWAAQSNETTMITRSDGTKQTLTGWTHEIIYGAHSQLPRCGPVEVTVCSLSVFIGGEIPTELKGFHLAALEGTKRVIGIANEFKKVPHMKIPIDMIHGGVSYSGAREICSAACEIKNQRMNGGG